MTLQDKLLTSFNHRVEGLINRSPFFEKWKPNRISRPVAERFIATFDVLVGSFPGLIALGAARAADAATRTVLATNLYEECGEGDVERTHHAIFRRFVTTAGIELANVPGQEFTERWRGRLERYLRDTPSQASVVGALAAGEVLAQPALSRIFSVIRTLFPAADTEYFTTHLEKEIEHVEEITALLGTLVERGEAAKEVDAGFDFGLAVWEDYFDSLSDYIFADSRPIEARPN